MLAESSRTGLNYNPVHSMWSVFLNGLGTFMRNELQMRSKKWKTKELVSFMTSSG